MVYLIYLQLILPSTLIHVKQNPCNFVSNVTVIWWVNSVAMLPLQNAFFLLSPCNYPYFSTCSRKKLAIPPTCICNLHILWNLFSSWLCMTYLLMDAIQPTLYLIDSVSIPYTKMKLNNTSQNKGLGVCCLTPLISAISWR